MWRRHLETLSETNLWAFACYNTFHALQRRNTKKSKQIFPEKELRGLRPNFYIHVPVSNLYNPTISLPILLQENMLTDPGNIYVNRYQTHECGNWDCGREIPYLGAHQRDFRCSVKYLHIIVYESISFLFLFPAKSSSWDREFWSWGAQIPKSP